jgi:hypothetical protein
MSYLNQSSVEMPYLLRKNQFPTLVMPQHPWNKFIVSINIGITLTLGETSLNTMNMMLEKQLIAMNGDIWRKRTKSSVIST